MYHPILLKCGLSSFDNFVILSAIVLKMLCAAGDHSSPDCSILNLEIIMLIITVVKLDKYKFECIIAVCQN